MVPVGRVMKKSHIPNQSIPILATTTPHLKHLSPRRRDINIPNRLLRIGLSTPLIVRLSSPVPSYQLVDRLMNRLFFSGVHLPGAVIIRQMQISC